MHLNVRLYDIHIVDSFQERPRTMKVEFFKKGQQPGPASRPQGIRTRDWG